MLSKEKENAAQDADNIRDGAAEQVLADTDSGIILGQGLRLVKEDTVEMNDITGYIMLAAKGTLPRRKLLDYTYTPEASATAERIMDRLAELLGGISTAENEMSVLLADLEDAYERQGFTNGCRYGAQLARELQV